MRILRSIFFSLLILASAVNAVANVEVIAAENFYGAIVTELGHPYVNVTSIISNPNQDPHLFSAKPQTAKTISQAQMIIYNGAGYDDWINPFLTTTNHAIINVGALLAVKNGANPHLWYNPVYMQTAAKAITEQLIKLDPNHLKTYQKNLKQFEKNNQQLLKKIKQLSEQYPQLVVTATEPVFGYMAGLLDFQMLHIDLQWAIMNDTDPSGMQIASYEHDLKTRKVKLLFYNDQVVDPLTEQFKKLATENHVPIIGVSETMPAIFTTYHEWMTAELTEVTAALNKIKHD